MPAVKERSVGPADSARAPSRRLLAAHAQIGLDHAPVGEQERLAQLRDYEKAMAAEIRPQVTMIRAIQKRAPTLCMIRLLGISDSA